MSLSQSVSSWQNNKLKDENVSLSDVNAVLQNAIHQFSPEDRNAIILRCDELPFLACNAADLEFAITGIMHLIVAQKTAVAKLYLHITCVSSEAHSINASNNTQVFVLQFNTNYFPDSDWYKKNEVAIKEIAAAIEKNAGQLTVNQLKNTGCIFGISLPGKKY